MKGATRIAVLYAMITAVASATNIAAQALIITLSSFAGPLKRLRPSDADNKYKGGCAGCYWAHWPLAVCVPR
jgi:hypothetical protein